MFTRKIATTTFRSTVSVSQCKKPFSVATQTAVKGFPTFSSTTPFSLSTFKKASTSTQHSRRYFSSEASGNMDSNLSQILTEEILEETSRKDEETDEDYDDVKKYITSVFQISEKTGYGEVTLSRTFRDEEIVIKFDCQDEADGNEDGEGSDGTMEDFENGESQQHNVDEEDAEKLDGKFGIHFEATIKKSNGDRAVFSCIATHQQPSIVHVSFIAGSISDEDASVYGGPRYEDLDPAVQGGLQQYLAERGVDDDLSFFVIQHSRYKEESEYLHWLKSLNEFVN